MKVSVIVPMYNSEAYIEECISSLLEQTLKDIEILIIDNRSTDNSVRIVRNLIKDKDNARLFINPINRGQAYSVNRGLSLAKGDYVAECDADDWVHPEMYEEMYTNAEGCDVVSCGWYDIYENHIVVRQKVNNRLMLNPMISWSKKNRANFIIGQPHIMSNLYKRSFLLEHGLKYREGYQFEDTSLAFKIRTTAQRYVFIPDCLYYYRKQVPGSGTMTIDSTDGVFQQYAEMYRWNKVRNLNLDRELGVAKYYTYLWGASRLKTDEAKAEFWKRASEEFKHDVVDEEFFFTEEDFANYVKIRDM